MGKEQEDSWEALCPVLCFGNIDQTQAIQRERVETEYVLTAVNERDMMNQAERDEAMLEVDGTISIIPSDVKPLRSKQKKLHKLKPYWRSQRR